MIELPEKMTWGELYNPAMEMTEPVEAAEYLNALIQRNVTYFKQTAEEAEECVKQNLGYISGYYDTETMVRVQRLFDCSHPVFGKIESKTDLPTPEEAFQSGRDGAEAAETSAHTLGIMKEDD